MAMAFAAAVFAWRGGLLDGGGGEGGGWGGGGGGGGVVRDAASRGVDGEGIAGLAPGWLVPIDGDLGGYCGAQHWQKLTV